ncbi:MAG: hypothetical protein WA364_23145, partial [Candidatus Nitrosopolaris sp.]
MGYHIYNFIRILILDLHPDCVHYLHMLNIEVTITVVQQVSYMINNTIGKVRDKDSVFGSKDDTEGIGYDSTKRYAHTNKNTPRLSVVFLAFAIITLLTIPMLSAITINAQTENRSSVTTAANSITRHDNNTSGTILL